ncbi:hypothetical protein MIR68_001846 [Amoeboaphelidium protococcarum]|nr:hypothetical protein MIR68_001846 [Amoeboaphelidium protococcarum]
MKSNVKCHILGLDLSGPQWQSGFEQSLKDLLERASRIFLFHNAGSLGPLVRVQDLYRHSDELTQVVNLNYQSVLVMTSIVMDMCIQQDGLQELFIVNISSLAAVAQFDAWSVYGSLKSARDHFIKSVAEEYSIQQSSTDNKKIKYQIKCLNYAPGPLSGTDMQPLIRSSMPGDSPVLKQFLDMHQQNELVEASDSARVLWKLLQSDQFTKGEHVDYYDVNNNK